MVKISLITLGVISLVAVAAIKPGYAANETQQLNQRISLLENQIQQLQTKLSENQAPVGYTPLVGYGSQWDPFVQVQDMQQQMDRMMNAIPVGNEKNVLNLNIDRVGMEQTPTQYLITMHIPGMEKSKISVELKDRVLVVSGSRSKEASQKKGDQYVSKESSYGYFMQSIVLPEDAVLHRISSQYKNGVLTISVDRERGHVNNNSEKILVK